MCSKCDNNQWLDCIVCEPLDSCCPARCTALSEAGRIKSGQTVLVTAAAGGTGQFAVQLAKLAGCHVVATCGGADKAAMLRRLGADRVVDYKTEQLKVRGEATGLHEHGSYASPGYQLGIWLALFPFPRKTRSQTSWELELIPYSTLLLLLNPASVIRPCFCYSTLLLLPSAQDVLHEEYPRGIDVVYESVGGDMFKAALDGLADRGRLIVIGMMGAYAEGWPLSTHPGMAEKLLWKSASVVSGSQPAPHLPERPVLHLGIPQGVSL